jgi:outer membrane protein TolC
MYQFHRRQARVEATEAILTARAARERVAVASDAVSAAKEGLRIVQNQYREGLASMVDLLDTQAAAIAAEGDLVTAVHDYHLGLARLRYSGAIGRPEQE